MDQSITDLLWTKWHWDRPPPNPTTLRRILRFLFWQCHSISALYSSSS